MLDKLIRARFIKNSVPVSLNFGGAYTGDGDFREVMHRRGVSLLRAAWVVQLQVPKKTL